MAKREFRTLEFVRRVRSEIAAKLEGKSDAEILALFNDADRRFRKEMGLKRARPAPSKKRKRKPASR